jgi:hypothetical protein
MLAIWHQQSWPNLPTAFRGKRIGYWFDGGAAEPNSPPHFT